MKKVISCVLFVLLITLCGCVGSRIGEEEDYQTTDETVAKETSGTVEPETTSEIPNEPDDGYSKRY